MLKLDQLDRERLREQLFDWIIKAIQEMPALLRQVFVLNHYRGLSADEISIDIRLENQDIPSLLRLANKAFYQNLRLTIATKTAGPSPEQYVTRQQRAGSKRKSGEHPSFTRRGQPREPARRIDSLHKLSPS